jgi:hypothetical protein
VNDGLSSFKGSKFIWFNPAVAFLISDIIKGQ